MKKILRLGNTTIEYFNKLNNKIFIKMENENPTGSIKDRSVWYMIKDKLNYNLKYKDSIHFVIASSGNAGISLSYFCKLSNNKCSIFVSKNIEESKYRILKRLGANVIVCDGENSTLLNDWIYESLNFFNQLDTNNKYYIDQFNNELNVKAHYDGTAPEIFSYFNDINDKLDYIFIGIGSGGTAEGIQEYIDDNNLDTKLVICDPYGGIFYDTFYDNQIFYKDHNIESISDSFIPYNIKDIKKFYQVVQFEDNILHSGREELLKDAELLAGDVLSFVYASLMRYIEINNLKGMNILIINTEDGFR